MIIHGMTAQERKELHAIVIQSERTTDFTCVVHTEIFLDAEAMWKKLR